MAEHDGETNPARDAVKAMIPSAYLVDKATKRKNEERLALVEEKIKNKNEITRAIVEGLSLPEPSGSDNLPVVPIEEPSILEKVIAERDVTLTELEKTLTEKQVLFAWNLAAARVSGKVNLTQCALDAGYSKAVAANMGSSLARDAKICEVVQARMPAEMKLLAFKRNGQDYVIENMLTIVERSLQAVPVLDKKGNPVGYYTYDGALAKSALDSLANWQGMTKQKIEMGGSTDGEPIRVDSRVVTASVMSISDRIRAAKEAKSLPTPLPKEDE